MNPTAGRRNTGLLPPGGPARGLAAAQLANSIGDGAFIVTSALFFTRVVGLTPGQVGLGLTIAWGLGFLTGVPLGLARRVTDLRSAARSVRYAGIAMLAACAVFAVTAGGLTPAGAAAVLAVGAVPLVLGEMLLASGAWEISFGLAPADQQGQYQGFFGSGPAIARMLGPVLLTTLILGWGPIGWLLVGGLFLGTSCATGPALRWAVRNRAAAQAVQPAQVEEYAR